MAKTKRRGATLSGVSDLKPAPYNPRKISPEAFDGLKVSIDEFGDLSGIVWNERTGHLVAGHRRLDALKANYGEALQLVTEDGSSKLVAGEREFSIRIVDWPESREKLANIAANNPHISGEYSEDVGALIAQLGETDLSALITPLRIDELIQPIEGIPGDQAGEQLDPSEGFGIVVYCTDEADQKQLFEDFESRGYKTRLLSI